jgi:thiamine biosynthesis protein ThiS
MNNSTIRIIVNGFPENIPEHMTVAQLIVHFKEGDRDLIVEHNGQFVYPSRYDAVVAADGDRIEFINPNFGG